MCECGCAIGNSVYRLPGLAGTFYAVEIYPGCKDCDRPPGIIVHRVSKGHAMYNYLHEAQLLPFNVLDDQAECPISCGIGPYEFRKVLEEELAHTVTSIDEAHEIADEVWKRAVHGEVKIVKAEKVKLKGG